MMQVILTIKETDAEVEGNCTDYLLLILVFDMVADLARKDSSLYF